MSGIPFESTRRGAEYYDRHIPKIVKSLERIANALKKVKQADQVRSMTDEFIDREMRDLMRRTIRCEESTQTGWISVKERMPDDSGDYIVLNDGRIEIAPYDKEVAQEGFYPFGYEDKEIDEMGHTLIDWIEISGVTHWMPLPALPKEVQDDESL